MSLDSTTTSVKTASFPQAEAPEVERYLDLLFPDPPPDAWLVVSWLNSQGDFPSQWFRAADREALAQCIHHEPRLLAQEAR